MPGGWMGDILVALWVVTAIVVTIFPLAYAFSPWHTSPEGRAIMLRSTAFMLMIDETVLLYFWPLPNEGWQFAVQATTLVFTIAAAVYLAYVLLSTQIRALRWTPRSARQR